MSAKSTSTWSRMTCIGPASAWIARAVVGDEVLILAPTTAHIGVSYGIDFVPPARTSDLLLAGDETAAPAIAVILEQLPADATGVVVLEVPAPRRRRLPAASSRLRVPRERPRRRRATQPPHPRRAAGGRSARARRPRQRGRRDRHRCRHPVGGAAHRQGRRGAQERAAVRVAGRRVGCHQGACAGTWSPSAASTDAQSPSWATGAWGARRTESLSAPRARARGAVRESARARDRAAASRKTTVNPAPVPVSATKVRPITAIATDAPIASEIDSADELNP